MYHVTLFSKTYFPKLYFLFLLIFFLFKQEDIKASHAVGLDIQYECLGGNQYRLTLNFYRDCAGVSAPTAASINVSSASCGISANVALSLDTFFEISPLCISQLSSSTCGGGNNPGIQQYIYSADFTFPQACPDWIISYGLCCRNAAITNLQNPSNFNIFAQATMNNTNGICNNSPIFTTRPVPFVCGNQPFNYNHGAVDIDGDSLVYSLINPLDAPGVNIPHRGGFSATNPLNTNGGFNFNGSTGQMSFSPNGNQQAVVTVLVQEFRNGVLIGSTMRDMQLVVIGNCNNNPPTATGINGTNQFSMDICAGFPLCFDIFSNDANAGQSTTLTLNNGINGSTFNTFGAPFQNATFCWTPSPNDVGANNFSITVVDDACPIFGSNNFTYTINVIPNPNPPIDAGPDADICSDQCASLQANLPPSVVRFSWSPSTGLSNINSTSPSACPDVTTVYTLSAVYADSCVSSDQVTVRVQPAPAVTVFPKNAVVCAGSSIQLSGTASTPSTFTWNNGSNGIPLVVTPTASGQYILSATNSFGCVGSDTAFITFSPPPPPQVCNNVYVTPNATGGGLSPMDPTDLLTAIGLAQCNNLTIKMAIGNYIINDPITLSSLLTIEGGFDPANNWRKVSTAGATTIIRSNLNVEGSISAPRLGAMYANGAAFWRLQDLTIRVSDAPLAIQGQPGVSLYGLHLTACNNYEIVRTQVIVGNAGGGGNGIAGTNGQAGAAGVNGLAGSCDGGSCTFGSGDPGGAGGAGGIGGGGVLGGLGGLANNNSRDNGQPGINGTTRNGGSGGGAGAGGDECSSIDAGNGAIGGSTPCAINGNGGIGGSSGNPGRNGTNGTNGANGISGATGVIGGSGSIINGFWEPGSSGTNGTDGCGGAGGGGGGGSGRQSCTFCDNGNGNGGGGGGGGGQGGEGGSGGQGGGSSFAIFLVNNGANGNLIDCNIAAGNAGAGGIGGIGGQGGAGGIGGAGNATCSGEIGTGGRGGNGGLGGNGGNGGNGQTGISNNLQLNSGAALATNISNFNLAAQPTITVDNTSCTNVDVNFTSASSSNWDFSPNATPANGSGNSVITQFSTVGRKNIVFNNNTYTGFYKAFIDNATFFPEITTTANPLGNDSFYVCAGTPTDFNTTTPGIAFNWDMGGGVVPNNYNTSSVSSLIFDTPGTYIIQLSVTTDCCGPSLPDTIILLVDAQTQVLLAGNTDICIGNSTAISLSGSTTYLWTPDVGNINTPTANITLSPLDTTLYTITGISPLGFCTTSENITINVNPLPGLSINSSPATCSNDGSATVLVNNGSGNYSYQWNDSNSQTTATASNLFTGNYEVTVTDNITQCVNKIFVFVPNNGAPVAFIQNIQNVSCFNGADGSAQVAVAGGQLPFTYAWSNGNTSNLINNVPANSYTVTVTDNRGCFSITTAFVAQPDSLIILIDNIDSVRCFGFSDASISIRADGGNGNYQFLWDTNPPATTPNLTLLAAGTYNLTVIDDKNCMATTSILISSPPPLSVIVSVNNATCFNSLDGSASISSSNAINSYVWNTGSSDSFITNVLPGTYFITLTDINGCSIVDSALITAPDSIFIDSLITEISCNGANDGAISLIASGGTPGNVIPYTFEWSNANTTNTISNLPPQSYSVTVTDGTSCSVEATFTMLEPALLTLTVLTQDISCNGLQDGSIDAQANGGSSPFTFEINGLGSQTSNIFQNLDTGTFTIEVVDSRNCSATTTTSITAPSPLQFLIETTNPVCFGTNSGFASVEVSGGVPEYEILWSSIPAQTGANANQLSAGNYSVQITDANFCAVNFNFTLEEPLPITVNATPDTSNIRFGETVELITVNENALAPLNYIWTPISGLSCSNCANPIAQPTSTTTYEVTLIDSNGCMATDQVLVEVSVEKILFVPNAFSPNRDNNNEIFEVYTLGAAAIQFRIFDRWGEKVFETNQLGVGWNGIFENKLMNPGVYVYYVEVTYIDGDKKSAKGSFVLIR